MGGILSGFAGFSGMNMFTPSRFEDLINRRGWASVLWERAVRCACYSKNTGNPDPACTTCFGVGHTWQEDLAVEVKKEQLDVLINNQEDFVLKASLSGVPCMQGGPPSATLVGLPVIVNETTGETYTVVIVSNTEIKVSGTALPQRCDRIFADYTYNRTPGVLKAIITGVDYQRDYIPAGEWLNGDAIMTVSGQYRMGFRDRITIPEQVVRSSEVEQRFEVDVQSRSLERLRYKTGVKIVQVRDRRQDFTVDVDFELGPDMTIVWLAGARPSHLAFNLKYTGDASTAVLVVTATELTVTLAGDQTDGSVSISLPFATYPTVTELVAHINTLDKYESGTDKESDLSGVDNTERNIYSIAIASADVKNISVTVSNEDRTQYAVEYMHKLAYSIFTRQGMPRRPDDGLVLPQKHWLRLWEHTDRFSNAG